MAKTPFVDLKSEDILSAHISGIQHAINNLENVLNMRTATKTGHVLVAVTDQDDATLHNFIYEGTIRNWITAVIKRGGQVVPASEYTLQAPYGAVIFKTQQNASDVITADITHVVAESKFKEAVNFLPMVGPIGSWVTHAATGGAYGTGVSTLGNTIDAFPFVVLRTTTYDKMMFEIGTVVGTKGMMGIYTDNDGFPSQFVAGTTEIDMATVGVKEAPFANGDVTLEPGMYWLARYHNGGASFNKGLPATSAIPLGDITDPAILSTVGAGPAGGVRSATVTYASAFPVTFPTIAAGSKYLYRSFYASPWIHRKA
jgi:hypothetical protein